MFKQVSLDEYASDFDFRALIRKFIVLRNNLGGHIIFFDK